MPAREPNLTRRRPAAYNFVRTHKTLRSSAMAAGLGKTLWSTGDLVVAAFDGVRR